MMRDGGRACSPLRQISQPLISIEYITPNSIWRQVTRKEGQGFPKVLPAHPQPMNQAQERRNGGSGAPEPDFGNALEGGCIVTTLREALAMTPWRQLRAIGRRRGLRLSSNLRKADLVDRLAQALADPTSLDAALTDLDQPERRTLSQLLAAGGRLPSRIARAISDRDRNRRHRPSPSAPLEQLRALGLIFHDRAADDLFIPEEQILEIGLFVPGFHGVSLHQPVSFLPA